MYYLGLGQAVFHKKYVNSPFVPAIITGFDKDGAPLITTITDDGELETHEHACIADIHTARKKDKKSPTGYSVYYGKMFKPGYFGHFKLKLPADSVIIDELKYIKKLIPAE